MGYQSLSGPEWLPGELDALFAREPEELEPTVPDPEDPWPVDVDDEDLGGWFESDPDYDPVPDSGPRSDSGPGCGGASVSPVSVVDRFAGAVGRLSADLDDLASLAGDPGLGLADGDLLIGWVRELERCRNRLQVPDQVLLNLMEAAGCRVDGPLGLFASPQAFLAALVGVPVGQARARVQAAGLFAPTVGTDGQRVPARFPVLGEAIASGEISADRVWLVTKALVEWEKLLPVDGNNVTAETLAEAEELLAAQARVFGGRQLMQVLDRVAAWLCPDGMVDDRPAQDAVRGLEVRPIDRGMHKGMYRVEGRLTAEAGAKVLAVLDPLSKPQPVTNESGHLVEQDCRDRGQRMHDALETVMDRSLRAGELPAHGGTPATLILLAEEDEFVAGTGAGVTETGDRLPMDVVRGLADEAEIVRTVFHKQTREVLSLGRTRRLASYAQTLALAARDGGCTFPGCDKSPKWCQRHHIVDWANGGPTDLPNLALLCGFHHARFARHGWSAEYQAGRVWWRPPKIIDPEQKPILNIRHRAGPLLT
ncbi:HNH endonuclease [Microlunatus endophyticus]|uniref:HNH endonuclease n=1 Tax=Microlunatus endophyticus TaxID=1716077 RepID=A0A917SBB8_9ACTN|nr:HNH endonuclease signature motif containing protein [Microlunatus endophyticus]GGL67226.1 HNH endonuclease [Microlunatus endophyticus]